MLGAHRTFLFDKARTLFSIISRWFDLVYIFFRFLLFSCLSLVVSPVSVFNLFFFKYVIVYLFFLKKKKVFVYLQYLLIRRKHSY